MSRATLIHKSLLTASLFALSAGVAVLAQEIAQDPGVRRGPADVGGARAGLSPVYQTEYLAAKNLFAREIDGVTGS